MQEASIRIDQNSLTWWSISIKEIPFSFHGPSLFDYSRDWWTNRVRHVSSSQIRPWWVETEKRNDSTIFKKTIFSNRLATRNCVTRTYNQCDWCLHKSRRTLSSFWHIFFHFKWPIKFNEFRQRFFIQFKLLTLYSLFNRRLKVNKRRSEWKTIYPGRWEHQFLRGDHFPARLDDLEWRKSALIKSFSWFADFFLERSI